MAVKRTSIPKAARTRSALLFAAVIAIYVITNTPVGSMIGVGKYLSWVSISLWLAMAAWVRRLPAARPDIPRRMTGSLHLLAVMMAGFAIVAQVGGGLLEKSLGKSPYSFTPFSILTNMLYVGAMVLGMEMTRSFLVNTWGKKFPWLTIAACSVLFALFNIQFSRFFTFKDAFEMTKYVGRFVLPALAEHMVASYFVSVGGAKASIYYRAPLLAFQWFCPILPNPGMIIAMFVGTIVPLVSLIIVQQMVLMETRQIRRGRDKEGPLSWVVTSLLSVGIVWFASGVFPIYPSVIVTGSMLPMIKPGDVILVKKVPDRQFHVGDVIQYRIIDPQMDITHRIIGVVTDDQGKPKSYVTQGDANPAPDSEPVLPAQVRGGIIKVVPKVGWPTLLLKGKAGGTDQKMEF